LAIGLLVAALRNAGFDARLISPLAHDVPAAERERAETWWDQMERRAHLSNLSPFRVVRDALRDTRRWWRNRPHPRVLAEVARALDDKPDAILLSAYLQHYHTVVAVGRLAASRGIPLLLGGPAFNLPGTAEHWRDIPGLKAVVGAEVDVAIPAIVEAMCADEDLLAFPGVVLPDGTKSPLAPPLRPLDALLVPDFTDFPWDRYPVRIIPMMAGRGCQWNRCNFCSDIISVSGRTFRTRSVEAVLHEMREQARRHQTSNFLFLDLKLNSNPATFRGIIEGAQRSVRGAQWIGTVHVDQRADNGLSRTDLREAVAAGMRRVSFGMESGSQRMLDAMDKGCTVETNAAFIREAYDAGLSVRATMFKGYPGETAEDLELTADFLERLSPYLDRVRFNDFSIPADTPIDRAIRADPDQYPNIRVLRRDDRNARTRYIPKDMGGLAYRRAKARVARAVFAINRRKLRSSAQAFDGLM
jgi:radical SAM superfamily enzyme YgiQ (UPF0313 family)